MQAGSRGSRVEGLVRHALFVLFGALTLACVVWAIAQASARLPDYPEACVLFNASRVRDGVPLYVTPEVGGAEYAVGPPSRYFVAYTPFYAMAIARVPAGAAMFAMRLFGLVAWALALVWPVARARGPEARRWAGVAALFVGSTFLFARWSACVKPDALALLLTSVALVRMLARRRVDAASGALLAVGAILKPSVIGSLMGVSVLVGLVVLDRARRGRVGLAWGHARGLVAAGAVVVVAFAGLEIGSGGLAVAQLRAALALKFEPSRFVEMNLSRGPFLAALVIVAALAAYPSRRSFRGKLALAALVGSVTTCAFGLGKLGSASNYLMEPSLLAVCVVAAFGLRLPVSRPPRAAALVAVAISIAWVDVATVRSLGDEVRDWGREKAELAAARAACPPRGFVLSHEPGIELAINGRIYTHGLEVWAATLAGRFPEQVWVNDITHPDVTCYIGATGPITFESPPGVFPPEVSRAIGEAFGPPERVGRFVVYRRTGGPER